MLRDCPCLFCVGGSKLFLMCLPGAKDFFQRAALAQLPAVRTGSATVEEKGEQMKAKVMKPTT